MLAVTARQNFAPTNVPLSLAGMLIALTLFLILCKFIFSIGLNNVAILQIFYSHR